MGRLTTHVLDTASGRPGNGLRIEVFRFDGDDRISLGEAVTNDDGRCDAPILEGEQGAQIARVHVRNARGQAPVSTR